MKLDLLTTDQLAARLGVRADTVRKWRARGKLAPVLVLAGHALYSPKTGKPPERKRGRKAKSPAGS